MSNDREELRSGRIYTRLARDGDTHILVDRCPHSGGCDGSCDEPTIAGRLYQRPDRDRILALLEQEVVGYVEEAELPVTGRATIHEHPNPSRVPLVRAHDSEAGGEG